MADSTTTAVLSAIATVNSKLSDLPLEDGQLIFVQDKQMVALDFGGKRKFYTQIEELATEDARTSLLAPVTGRYYYVMDPPVLWRYEVNGWVQITTPPDDIKAIENAVQYTRQDLTNDQKAQVYKNLNIVEGDTNRYDPDKVMVFSASKTSTSTAFKVAVVPSTISSTATQITENAAAVDSDVYSNYYALGFFIMRLGNYAGAKVKLETIKDSIELVFPDFLKLYNGGYITLPFDVHYGTGSTTIESNTQIKIDRNSGYNNSYEVHLQRGDGLVHCYRFDSESDIPTSLSSKSGIIGNYYFINVVSTNKVNKNAYSDADEGKVLTIVNGAVTPEELPEIPTDTVQYVEQTLTEDQQMQARANLNLYNTLTTVVDQGTITIADGNGSYDIPLYESTAFRLTMTDTDTGQSMVFTGTAEYVSRCDMLMMSGVDTYSYKFEYRNGTWTVWRDGMEAINNEYSFVLEKLQITTISEDYLPEFVSPDEMNDALNASNKPVTTSGDGATYTATVDGIIELTAGVSFIMIPHTVSTSTTPKLNVNGLGEKYIRRRLSTSSSTTVAGYSTNWLGANKPMRVVYDGTYWIVDLVRPSASDIYGILPITCGGTEAATAESARANLGAMADVPVTASDAGKFLRVSSDGVWVAEEVPDAESTSF